ncbi:SGNH/GDSL hydrolase family protein [Roseateles sp. BYS180W]|uniref:SGNH/GDSL hydrolase family protein n=1 Tax=Roseateles rivi TaxID=3299028 RepID=A0ABW7FZG4_9BURK
MGMNRRNTLALAMLAMLAACGGGGEADTTPRAHISAVKVMGDSLADVGTFGGVRATIQGNDMYPELVSQAYGLDKGCNFFAFTGSGFAPNAKAGCGNFAVGGGVINAAGSGYVAQDPRGLAAQFAAATAGGNFAAGDLLIVDGGGNDAAKLVGDYLLAARDGGVAYTTLLGTLLSAQQVQAAAAGGAAGLAQAGATYMTALANQMADLVQTQALAKGAQRVVLLNMPGITNTPRFQMVLDGIAAASGGGSAGAAARTQSEALFKGWMEAFNAQLQTRFAGESRVALVDFYTAFNDQVATPEQFGLSNVKTPACPVTGKGADGLPTYTFATCTEAALAAAAPSGAGPDWYKTWAFSDSFHPTGYGHKLVYQLISRRLAQAAWL